MSRWDMLELLVMFWMDHLQSEGGMLSGALDLLRIPLDECNSPHSTGTHTQTMEGNPSKHTDLPDSITVKSSHSPLGHNNGVWENHSLFYNTQKHVYCIPQKLSLWALRSLNEKITSHFSPCLSTFLLSIYLSWFSRSLYTLRLLGNSVDDVRRSEEPLSTLPLCPSQPICRCVLWLFIPMWWQNGLM